MLHGEEEQGDPVEELEAEKPDFYQLRICHQISEFCHQMSEFCLQISDGIWWPANIRPLYLDAVDGGYAHIEEDTEDHCEGDEGQNRG